MFGWYHSLRKAAAVSGNKFKGLPKTGYPLQFPRPHLSRKHGFIYYLIPKTACTTVKAFIIKIDGIEAGRTVHTTDMPRIDLTAAMAPSYRDYFHFAFVRNPYDRLLSCYLEKIYFPAMNNRDDHAFAHGEYRAFRERYGNLGFKRMSFGDFVRFARDVPNKYCDAHFMPQHYFLNFKVMDFIGRFENFRMDFSQVMEKIKPNYEYRDDFILKKRMSTDHKHYSKYYDEEMRKIVTRKYARDLEIFNYSF